MDEASVKTWLGLLNRLLYPCKLVVVRIQYFDDETNEYQGQRFRLWRWSTFLRQPGVRTVKNP